MKFFNHKANLLNVLLIVGVFVSFYFGRFLTFTTIQKIFVGIVFLIGILVISLSPRKKSEQEIIEDEDERNQYIAMKCAAETLKTVGYGDFLAIMSSLICFGLTNEFFFLWIMIGAAIPYSVLKIAAIIFAFRYDKG